MQFQLGGPGTCVPFGLQSPRVSAGCPEGQSDGGGPKGGIGRDTRGTLCREKGKGLTVSLSRLVSSFSGRGTLGPDAPSGGSCDVLHALFNETPRVGRHPAFRLMLPPGRAGAQEDRTPQGSRALPSPRTSQGTERHWHPAQEDTAWNGSGPRTLEPHHAGRRCHLQHGVLADRALRTAVGRARRRGMRPGGQWPCTMPPPDLCPFLRSWCPW